MARGFISISLKECLVALYMPDKEGYIENIETYHRHGLRESHNNRRVGHKHMQRVEV